DFFKFDLKGNPDIMKFGVKAIPCLLFFNKKKEPVNMLVGAVGYEEVMKKIEKMLNSGMEHIK
ncbi:unnamed protein product, partial [marine sediment metagenome]